MGYNKQKQKALKNLLFELIGVVKTKYENDSDKYLDIVQVANILKVDLDVADELVQFMIKDHIEKYNDGQKRGFKRQVEVNGYYLFVGFKLIYPSIKGISDDGEVEFNDVNFKKKEFFENEE